MRTPPKGPRQKKKRLGNDVDQMMNITSLLLD